MTPAHCEGLLLFRFADPHLASFCVCSHPFSLSLGKSTLVNYLVGTKISAVSHKRNTTRTSVLGVACRENRQLVLFDTPGILPVELSNKYQKELSVAAFDSAQGCDIAVLIIDVVKRLSQSEYELIEKARLLKESQPEMELILVLNKMDLCETKSRAKGVAEQVRTLLPSLTDETTFFTAFTPLSPQQAKRAAAEATAAAEAAASSSKTLRRVDTIARDMGFTVNTGVTALAKTLFLSARPGEWEYPETTRTDMSPVELVNEIVREKIFHRVHQEIPYRVKIRNTGWTEIDDSTLRIDIMLEVDTKQQKLILTGHRESMLKQIIIRALPDIQALLGKKVYLFLKCTIPTTL